MSMDPELKAKWVEALRSGKYKQAIGLLKDENSYCCLGVLCDVMGANWLSGEPILIRGEDEVSLKDASGDELLSPDAIRIAGLPNVQMDLAEMNDNGKSFAEIADHIEANL